MPALVSTAPMYNEALAELGRRDERVVTIDADLMRSVGSESFARQFPERSFQVGIAEQNMVAFAAGLASCGKIPFAHTFGVFASRRVCDQLAISVAFNRLNVKVLGAQAGLSAALNGATHQSLEDVTIVRAIPNMTIVEPCDGAELMQVVPAVAAFDGPVYLRLSKVLPEQLSDEPYLFQIGVGRVMREGKDVAIITSGVMAGYALEAAESLAAEGISAHVLNLSTLKPLDVDAMVDAAKRTGAVVTVENHTVNGGLGGAVAETLGEHRPTRMIRLGTQDTFGGSAELPWLVEHFGIGASSIVAAAKRLLESRSS